MKGNNVILTSLFYLSLILFLFSIFKENYPSISFLNSSFALIVVNLLAFVVIVIRNRKNKKPS